MIEPGGTPRVDLTGRVFGKITVVKFAGRERTNTGTTMCWQCRCVCGTGKMLRGRDLTGGKITSCGCGRGFHPDSHFTRLPSGEASFRALFKAYRKGALERGLSFELDEVVFRHLTSSDCTYCGVAPRQIRQRQIANGWYQYNGLDRIDSAIGYLESNVCACCSDCNYAKGTKSVADFVAWVNRSYLHMKARAK